MPRTALAVIALSLTSVLVVAGGSLADGTLRASLDYSIEPGGYDNTIRVAPLNALLYPRVAVDGDPASPFYGRVYVVGLGNLTCAPLVVFWSSDRGRTFDGPHTSDLCLQGPSLDVAVGGNGALYAATWGPTVLRSSDSGVTWTRLATLDDASSPSSIAVDSATATIHVTWGPSDSPWGFSPGPLLLSSSRDGGQTWGAPAPVGVALGAHPQVAARADSVLIAFVSAGPVEPSVAAIVSSDKGDSWGNIAILSAPGPCAAWSIPSVTVSPDGVFAVSWNEDASSDSCWSDWGNSTRTFLTISTDHGRTFSAPQPAGGPPGWIGAGFGDAVVFDDASRLYVTWHSIAPGWSSADVYVANSTDFGANFDRASFATRFMAAGGNATMQENLAAGPGGSVYLAWEAVGSAEDPADPANGIFVRAIAGQALGNVLLRNLQPQAIEIEVRDPRTGDLWARVDWSGTTVAIVALPPAIYDVWLRVDNSYVKAGSLLVRTWSRTTFVVHLEVEAGGPVIPWATAAGVAVALVVLSAVFASLHYTRLEREKILQRKVRLLMFEYIQKNPGASFSEVRDCLGLRNGVAAYHLAVLEKQALVHSETRRRHRWYYPSGDISKWRDLPLSPLQVSILDEVRRSPGVGIRQLARSVESHASSVAYNVKVLAREGLLRTERARRRVRLFPTDAQPSS